MSLKLHEYYSYCSLIPYKEIARKSMLECGLDCDANSNNNARKQVRVVKQNDSASSAASTPLPRGDATLEEMSNMSEDELMRYFMAQSLGMS